MSGADNTSLTVKSLGFPHDQLVDPSDSIIVWLSGNFASYTLPKASAWPGRMLAFIQDNGGVGVIQIFPASGDTADGTTQSWQAGDTGVKGRITIVSDGVSGWWSTSTVNVSRV
jgi:hypothetical protein